MSINNITKINIDSHQVFPELETNKIDNTICKSDNPKTGLFLLENKHLINKEYLNSNTNNWAVNFLINNPEYKYEYQLFDINTKFGRLELALSFGFLKNGLKYDN